MLVIYLGREVCENEKECENTYSMNSEVDIYPSTSKQFPTNGILSPSDAVFSCEVCDKTFEKKQDLQRHYSFHIVGKPFVCKKCDSSFMRESALTMHRCPAVVQPIKVHTEVPKQKTIMQVERVKPINEKPYICEVCDVKFMCKSNLKIHLKKNKCITAYHCTICRCNFKQLSSLARHHNKIHLGVDLKDDSEENNNKSNQPDLPHTCEVCGMKFSKKVYLIQHLPVHKGEKALTKVQENLEKEEILVAKFEKKELSKKPTKCEICGQKYTKRYDILRHMSTHTGEKAYKCDLCRKNYISKSTLLVHRRRFHSGIRPFACDLCPRAFLRKPELETHYFTHKEYKPYTCGDCKTGFCYRKSLERHIRMQTCVGTPQNASFENIEEVYSVCDNSKKESNLLKTSGNSSDSDDLNFSWPQSDMRRTRSLTALIARQKANLKAFKKLSENVNNELVPKNFEFKLFNEKPTDSQKQNMLPLLVGEQSTIQQRCQTSNVSNTEISHLNPQSSTNDFNFTYEESCVFSCNLCHEVFKSKQDLLKHYSVHNREIKTKQETRKNLKPYVCNTCGLCFRLKREVVAHSDVHEPVKDYICVDCNLSFNDESHFTAHACKDKELKISGQSFETFSDDQGKLNEQVKVQQENNLFECSMCSKSFELEKDLKYHLASHALNKGFFCNMCPKAFYLEKDLSNHVLSHSKKKSFPCKICDEDFDLDKNLKKHLLTHWSSGLICKHCHEGFDIEEDLKNHVDACPSKNNFLCNVCQKSFRLKCALVSHAKTHQRALEEKQFDCKFCGRSFLSNLDLRQHLRSHSGEKRYFCQECGKGYFLKPSLRAHIRYHSLNRPHACDRCDKKYVCKRDLDIHYLKHTDGVASYICDACGQGFCLEEGLKKHLISEHGKTYKNETKKKQDISSDCCEVDIL